MSFDGIRGYVQFASGIGDATRARAAEVAQGLVSMLSRTSPNDMAGQVSALADELLNAAKSNREGLVKLIRGEVSDLIDSSSSLAKAADLDAVRSMLSQLGTDLDGLRHQVGLQSPTALVSSGAAAVVSAASSVRPGGSRSASKPAASPAKVKRVPSRPRGSAVAAAASESKPEAASAGPAATPAVRKVASEPKPQAAPASPVRKLTATSAPATAPAKKTTPAQAAPAKKAAPANKEMPTTKA